jgi:hypothetical protein
VRPQTISPAAIDEHGILNGIASAGGNITIYATASHAPGPNYNLGGPEVHPIAERVIWGSSEGDGIVIDSG